MSIKQTFFLSQRKKHNSKAKRLTAMGWRQKGLLGTYKLGVQSEKKKKNSRTSAWLNQAVLFYEP